MRWHKGVVLVSCVASLCSVGSIGARLRKPLMKVKTSFLPLVSFE